jgi:4-amino-4-deoxy-L-arabinose transferase-like glycosyltransferase
MTHIETEKSSRRSARAEQYFLPERSSQEMWIAFLLFVVTCLYLRLFYRYTTFHSDEGLILQGAQRIIQGQVLYRDFFSFYPPGSYYWLALLFKVFGSSILVGRAALMVYGGLFSVLTYLLARRVCSRSSALFGAYTVTLTCLPYRFMVLHNWDSTLLAYLTVYCAVLFLERGHWTGALGTGSLGALTCLFEQSKGAGLVLGLGLGFLVITLGNRHAILFDRTRKAALAAGFAWPFLITLAYFGARHSLPQALADWFWPLGRYASVNAVPFGYSMLFTESGRALLGNSLSGKLLVFLLTSPLLVIPLLPIAALAVFGFASAERWRTKQCNRRRTCYILVSATLSGLLVGLLITGRPDFTHIAFLGPPYYLVLAWAIDVSSPFRRSFKLVGTFFLFLVFTAFGMSLLLGGPLGARHWIATRRGTLKTAETGLLLEFLQAHVSPGEKIFVYPSQPLYYYLTGTFNPTSYEFFQLGLFSQDQFQEAIRQLAFDQTRVVLIDPFTSEKFLFISPATPPSVLAEPDPVADYVFSHFRPCVREAASNNTWRFIYMVPKELTCPDDSALIPER